MRAERVGDRVTESLTEGTLSGVRALRGLPGGFLLSVEPMALKFVTHSSIDFLFETASF